MDRREFIGAALASAAAVSLPWNIGNAAAQTDTVGLVKAANGEPAVLVKTVVEKLGGMSKFISKGDKVLVKPNIGWDRNVAQGANTHPEVVAETVRLCLAAGAAEVLVFDNPCNSAERCYANSGIAEAAKKAGAKVSFMIEAFYRETKIANGTKLKSWKFYRPALDADKYINLPVLKHHGLADVTIGLKNIMGIIGGNRGMIHYDFDSKIVDLNTMVKPVLTIVDATRILKRNGPTGGSLGDVINARQLIAGIDPVAVDAAGAELFGIKPEQLGALLEADRRGLGKIAGRKAMVEIDLGA